MSTAVPTKNLTSSVRVDFEDGQIHAAEPRKIGAFIDGYEAMAADTQREKEAQEWLQISGETLKLEPVANNME